MHRALPAACTDTDCCTIWTELDPNAEVAAPLVLVCCPPCDCACCDGSCTKWTVIAGSVTWVAEGSEYWKATWIWIDSGVFEIPALMLRYEFP